EIYVLFYMTAAIMATPFQGLLWNQYLVQGPVAKQLNLAAEIPRWVAPAPDSQAYVQRSLLHWDFMPAIILVVVRQALSRIDHFGLGYVLYRITSDVEKLPFPMATIGAQGSVALAESGKETWRWRCFSIGSMMGLIFGSVYIGIPAVTGAILAKPIQVIPIPWADWTTKTAEWLPAVATGMSFDLGGLLMGMLLPFWAVVGSFIGLMVTFVANPFLHRAGVLRQWQPTMDTVSTKMANYQDFYVSFTIGLSVTVGVIGIVKAIRSMKKPPGERSEFSKIFDINKVRGDISVWVGIAIYLFSTTCYILLCLYLLEGTFPIIFFIIYGFLWTPFISYVCARMEGIAGQFVNIPMIREATFILSGYRGIDIWFAPIPLHNYGMATVQFRQIELTGTRLSGIIKTNIVVFPIIMTSSIIFSQYLWRLAEIPSAAYPFAQKMWELQAFRQLFFATSTRDGYSPFLESFNFGYLGLGLGLGLVTYCVLSIFGLPVLLIYGVVRGLGESMPHGLIPQFAGALIGRYYFQKHFGKMWRQYIPVIIAGYSCGMGLVGMGAIAVALLSRSLSNLLY
ncbi:peptide transporter, partial [Planctomycetota bacterium]